MVEYPLFIPPADLAGRTPREWRPSEADRYRDWLVAALPERTDALRRFLNLRAGERAADELREAGRRAAALLPRLSFARSVDARWQLTDAGYALAADLGLLVARRLVEHHPTTLKWETVRRPKRDMAYHHPVLVGFSTGMYLDPVGGSIAEAFAVLGRVRGPDAWERVFTFWSARAEA